MATDPRTTQAVVYALLEGGHAASDPIVNFVQVMLSGFGYNFHNASNVARSNDQLVRARAAELLGDATKALVALEAAFREAYVPASTREQPFPPAEVMTALRSLDVLRKRVGESASTVLTLEAPGNDRIWGRLRTERDLLERLLAADIGLVVSSHDVLDAARALLPTAVQQRLLSPVESPLAALDNTLRDRRAIFAILV